MPQTLMHPARGVPKIERYVVVYRISRNCIRDTTSHLTEPPDVAHEFINTDARHVRRLCWEGGAGSAAGAEK